ncbi:MAG: hypothetical protein KJ621_21100 [Proteobacteria bacterium]|nr:hypothetical protein [Pseudomonadota bacterium]
MQKIAVCVPIWDTVSGVTFASFTGLFYRWREPVVTEKYDFQFCYSLHQYMCPARNSLVKEALERGADWILFIDGDSVFKDNTIPERLVEKAIKENLEVVSAVCFGRDDFCSPYVFQEKDGLYFKKRDFIPNKDLIEVGAVGFGCTLISAEVFGKLEKPYFETYYQEDGKSFVGEDISFSKKAKELGCKLWSDSNLCYEHYGSITSAEDFMYRRNAGIERERFTNKILQNVVFPLCRAKEIIGEVYNIKELMGILQKIKEGEFITNDNFFRLLLEDICRHLYTDQRKLDERVTAEVVNIARTSGDIKVLSLDMFSHIQTRQLLDMGIKVKIARSFLDYLISDYKFCGLDDVDIDANFNSREFDIIIASDFFEHLSDERLAGALDMIKKIGKKGCRLMYQMLSHNEAGHNHYGWTAERLGMVRGLGK